MAHPEANAALGNSSGSIKTISAGLAGTHIRAHTHFISDAHTLTLFEGTQGAIWMAVVNVLAACSYSFLWCDTVCV